MPSRLLREGILTSERINQLDSPAEVFYRRLMSKVDDYGLFDARLSILRSSLYPLRVDRVREADIARWIAACETAGVIALYEHGGKPYGQMLDTGWQQRSEPKHPLPPWGRSEPTRAAENSCEQAQTPVPVFGDVVVVDKKKGARKRAPVFDAAEIEIPEWLDREDWQRWCKDRKARGRPITEEGARGQLVKLGQYRDAGTPPKAVIEHSIAGGYQGLFPPASNGAQLRAVQSVAQQPSETVEDYVARVAAEQKARELSPDERAKADAARIAAMVKLGRVGA